MRKHHTWSHHIRPPKSKLWGNFKQLRWDWQWDLHCCNVIKKEMHLKIRQYNFKIVSELEVYQYFFTFHSGNISRKGTHVSRPGDGSCLLATVCWRKTFCHHFLLKFQLFCLIIWPIFSLSNSFHKLCKKMFSCYC